MKCIVTRSIVDAACTTSRVRFSGTGCTKQEGGIIDRITTARNGLLMLKIVLYE